MSTNRNRGHARLKTAEITRDCNCIVHYDEPRGWDEFYPNTCDPYDVAKFYRFFDNDPYWDEGVHFYPNHNRGFAAYGNRKKQIYPSQRRMYKTWKHNRKTQWRN